ncbi:MAG: hypothetical protein KKD44_18820 [Proteobacteria bacterium]|nr:hypothetical protein [Pseudomonadota bacterium]
MDEKKQSEKDLFDLDDELIELTDTVQDEEIIDLTIPPDDTDDIIDLTQPVQTKIMSHSSVSNDFDDDDIIDLMQPVNMAEGSPLDLSGMDDSTEDSAPVMFDDDSDEIIELGDPVTQILDDDDGPVVPVMVDEEENILDLSEPVTQILDEDKVPAAIKKDIQDPYEFSTQTMEEELVDLMGSLDDDDEILDLTDSAGQTLDDEFLDLTIPTDDDEILELTDSADQTLDDEILDLTIPADDEDEILELTDSADQTLDDEILDLTTTVDEDAEILELTDSADQTLDDGILDLTDTATMTIDEEILLDLTYADDAEDVSDQMEPPTQILDELTSDFPELTVQDNDFASFSEQTSDNLQFDLSEIPISDEKQPTIINAEPVKGDFDFDSFAEQTSDNLRVPLSDTPKTSEFSSSDTYDMDDEIIDLTLVPEDLEALSDYADGEYSDVSGSSLDDTVEMDAKEDDLDDFLGMDVEEDTLNDTAEISSVPDSEDMDSLVFDDTVVDEFLDLSDIVSDSTEEQLDQTQEDLMDITWDDGHVPGAALEETIGFSELEDEIDKEISSHKHDDKKSITESLGFEIPSENQEGEGATQTITVSQEQLDQSVERVLRKLYGEKIDAILTEVIGKTVSQDIERLKGLLVQPEDK